jgi:hypothetical protein
MAVPPFIVGFVKFLLVIRERPLRVRREHVPGVRLEARQIGIAHPLDTTAQFSKVERLSRYRESKLGTPCRCASMMQADLDEDGWLGDVIDGDSGFWRDRSFLVFTMAAGGRVSHRRDLGLDHTGNQLSRLC